MCRARVYQVFNWALRTVHAAHYRGCSLECLTVWPAWMDPCSILVTFEILKKLQACNSDSPMQAKQ